MVVPHTVLCHKIMNFEADLINSNVKVTQITKGTNTKYLKTDGLCNWTYDTKSFRSNSTLSDKKKKTKYFPILKYQKIICNHL